MSRSNRALQSIADDETVAEPSESEGERGGDETIAPRLRVAFDDGADPWLRRLPVGTDFGHAAQTGCHLPSGAQFTRFLEERRQSLAKGFDRLISLDELTLRLYPHQRRAVLRVLRDMRGRALLADEVGLGKTIEAGVIAKEYIVRGLARRVLVLTPASLTEQWRNELHEKLDLPCRLFQPGDSWREHERLIASIDTARRPEHAEVLQSLPWDIVIVDEAHRLKNRRTRNWKLVDGLQKKYMLLLTATPIQNELEELYNMMTLLHPGLLETYSAFKREHVADRRSAKQAERLRARIGHAIVRTTREKAALPFPKRLVRAVSVPLTDAERSFYEQVLSFARAVFVEKRSGEGANVLPLILLLRQLCSSPEAVRSTLLNMAKSEALTDEQRAWANGLAVKANPLCGASSKLTALGDWIESAGDTAIVFTEFRATQTALVRRLKQRHIPVVAFHGGMDAAEKAAAVDRFRGEGGVLVSTEAGGEGQNLQFCRTVINCDLPWNPLRVEQRIGRVHRLGQEKDVLVVNVLAPDTMEMHVFRLLHEKINLFEQVIGELDVILTRDANRSLLPGATFERQLATIFLEETTGGETERQLASMGAEMSEKVERLQSISRRNARLLPEDAETDRVPRDGRVDDAKDFASGPAPLAVSERQNRHSFVPVTTRLLHPLSVDPHFASDATGHSHRPHPSAAALRKRLKQLRFTNGRVREAGRRVVHLLQWHFSFVVAYRSDETREALYTVAVDPWTERARIAQTPDNFVDACLRDIARGSPRAESAAENYRESTAPSTGEKVHYVTERLYETARRFLKRLIEEKEGVQYVEEAAGRLARDKERLDVFYEGLEEEALIPVVQQLRRLETRRTREQWERFVVPEHTLDGKAAAGTGGRVAEGKDTGGQGRERSGSDLTAVQQKFERITLKLQEERRRRLEELAVKYSVRATVKLIGAAHVTTPRVELSYRLLAPVRRDLTFFYDPLQDEFVDLECERCGASLASVRVREDGELICSSCDDADEQSPARVPS